MSLRPLRRSPEARKTIVTLADAFRRCLLLPGAVGEMVPGGRSTLRSTGEGASALRFRVLKVDLPRNALVVAIPLEAEAMSPGDQVRLFFAREEGVYVGGGVVQERRWSRPERMPVLEVWLPTLRLVQERRQARVHVPGARAELTVAGRREEALVLNLNAGGMMVRTAAEMAVGEEAEIALHLPWGPALSLRGKVIWVEEVGGVSTGLAGVRFEEEGEATARLRSLCQVWQAMRS